MSTVVPAEPADKTPSPEGSERIEDVTASGPAVLLHEGPPKERYAFL